MSGMRSIGNRDFTAIPTVRYLVRTCPSRAQVRRQNVRSVCHVGAVLGVRLVAKGGRPPASTGRALWDRYTWKDERYASHSGRVLTNGPEGSCGRTVRRQDSDEVPLEVTLQGEPVTKRRIWRGRGS